MAYVSDRMSLDLTSRLLAIFSTIIALGVAAFAFSRIDSQTGNLSEEDFASLKASFSEELKRQEAEFKSSREALEQRYQTALDSQDAKIRKWDSELTSSLNKFAGDAQGMIEQLRRDEDLEAETRRVAFRQTLESIRDQLAGTTPANNNDSTEAELNGPANANSIAGTTPGTAGVDDRDAADAAPEINGALARTEPALKIATTTYRAGQATTLLVVENVSAEDITVDRIRFRPKSRFAFNNVAESASDLRLIRFGPDDNTASDPQLHGTYDHRPTQPIKIAAGQKASLRFSIQDRTYSGWAFSGRMVMDYVDQAGKRQMLIAESAKVSFSK